MCLVDLDAEVILDSLHGQVLPQRPELVVNIFVVRSAFRVLRTQHLESLVQHRFGSHFGGVGSRCKAEVRLLDLSARASDGEVFSQFIQVHLRLFFIRVARRSVRICKQLGLSLLRLRLLLLFKLFKSFESFEHFEVGGIGMLQFRVAF